MSDEDAGTDPEHRRDVLDGAVDPAVARVRDLVDGGLVGWARRQAALRAGRPEAWRPGAPPVQHSWNDAEEDP